MHTVVVIFVVIVNGIVVITVIVTAISESHSHRDRSVVGSVSGSEGKSVSSLVVKVSGYGRSRLGGLAGG